jgi:hypothetical protein
MWRVKRIYDTLGCKAPSTLFSDVLCDGRFADELLSIVYERPELVRYFKSSMNALIALAYTRLKKFDEFMDRVVASFDDEIVVDVPLEAARDVQVGRVLVHMLQRYPDKVSFVIGTKICSEDIDVLNAIVQANTK